ncbi:MAG: peptide deformylase [Acidimicrobiales bacterium]
MARRKIRVLGDPVLRSKATEVVDFDRSLRRLVSDLADTMVEANGSGLAAPQIGVGLRAFTFGVSDEDDEDGIRVGHLVNPVIAEVDPEEVEDEEGCLSIPGVYCQLRRSRRVVAKGYDQHGEPLEVVGTERLARALLHESDHLDGVLFLDRLDPEVRKGVLREMRERMLEGEELVVRDSPHAPLG